MIAPGRMPWSAVLKDVLKDYECYWQDLDGAHISAAPQDAPLTSIMWAWPVPADGRELVRLRIDGPTVYVATYQPPAGDQGVPLQPWADDDGRVQQVRFAEPARALNSLEWRMFIEPISAGVTPVTFFSLAPESARRSL